MRTRLLSAVVGLVLVALSRFAAPAAALEECRLLRQPDVQGDRIVAVAGHVVRSVAELATELYADPPGTELVVTVVRDGTKMRTTVVLGQG